MWMGCRASLTAAVLDVRRMGMRCGRPPQVAIPPIRPATPRALTRLFVSLSVSPVCSSRKGAIRFLKSSWGHRAQPSTADNSFSSLSMFSRTFRSFMRVSSRLTTFVTAEYVIFPK